MGKKINQLTAVTDATAANNNQVFPLADPGTGIAGKISIGQMKKVAGTFKKRYNATGSEGTTLTISELSGMEVLSIMRGAGPLYPVDLPATPQSDEYTFDGTDIRLGVATSANEPFLILYKTPA